MKTLLLLRHAKAVSEESHYKQQGDDHSKPLSERGESDATQMGAYLLTQALQPEMVYCSTAKRTQDTFTLLATAMQSEPQLVLDKNLYLASPGDMLDVINAIPAEIKTAMLIGHNPGMHLLAQLLVHMGAGEHLQRLDRNFPTSALAELRFEVNAWSDIVPATAQLMRFVMPKTLSESS